MYLNGEGPLPPPAVTTKTVRRQGPPVGRRARGTWTATLDYVQKTLHLGALLLATQDDRSEYARDERSGLLVLLSARCAATPRRGAIQASTTRPARSALSQHAATLPASRFASHSISPHAASARPSSASAPSLVPPTRSELFPRAFARDSNPCEKRRGLLILPSASCSATPQRSRPKPPQPDMFAPGHARLLSFCQPRALHVTSIVSRTARACLGTVSAPFFLVLPTGSELCPRAGILESRRNNQRPRQPVLAVLPRVHGPRANLRQESGRSSLEITGLRELVQVGLL